MDKSNSSILDLFGNCIKDVLRSPLCFFGLVKSYQFANLEMISNWKPAIHSNNQVPFVWLEHYKDSSSRSLKLQIEPQLYWWLFWILWRWVLWWIQWKQESWWLPLVCCTQRKLRQGRREVLSNSDLYVPRVVFCAEKSFCCISSPSECSKLSQEWRVESLSASL